ncbi:hypothetical protein [Amycolatopsis sp. NPDC004079]|uniref:hypothetical protein n=1 Tax=Amycolatopsis sp. NPDC004079 TaxID=3154549 RepID=UPI0033B2ACB0
MPAWQPLDRDTFVAGVEDLLRTLGHEPGIVDDRVNHAAENLLSAFKICPTRPLAEAVDLDGGARYSARMHGD